MSSSAHLVEALVLPRLLVQVQLAVVRPVVLAVLVVVPVRVVLSI